MIVKSNNWLPPFPFGARIYTCSRTSTSDCTSVVVGKYLWWSSSDGLLVLLAAVLVWLQLYFFKFLDRRYIYNSQLWIYVVAFLLWFDIDWSVLFLFTLFLDGSRRCFLISSSVTTTKLFGVLFDACRIFFPPTLFAISLLMIVFHFPWIPSISS